MGLAFPFLAGYVLDLLLGDPQAWPHPIRLLGRLINFWERVLYRPRITAGGLFWLAVTGTALAVGLGLVAVAAYLPAGAAALIFAYCIYAGLATRSLHQESRRVEAALARGDLPGARTHLSLIVGRETASLSPEGVRRAVVETVAENLADGVVAPMFFVLVLGLPGLILYKTANTLDSMVGYKNDRYTSFGKVAARADDVLNFLPARLTAVLMVLAATPAGLDRYAAWRIVKRDSTKASSPNAGWPEAAMAGALGVRLGGPSTYFGRVVDKPFIGEARQPLEASHYRGAVRLLYATSMLMAGLTFLALYLSGAGAWGVLGRFF